jgi:hypothetical protein
MSRRTVLSYRCMRATSGLQCSDPAWSQSLISNEKLAVLLREDVVCDGSWKIINVVSFGSLMLLREERRAIPMFQSSLNLLQRASKRAVFPDPTLRGDCKHNATSAPSLVQRDIPRGKGRRAHLVRQSERYQKTSENERTPR